MSHSQNLNLDVSESLMPAVHINIFPIEGSHSAVHCDVKPYALMEVMEEQRLKITILLKAWRIASLKLCSSQAPVVFSGRLWRLLLNGKCGQSSRGWIGVGRILQSTAEPDGVLSSSLCFLEAGFSWTCGCSYSWFSRGALSFHEMSHVSEAVLVKIVIYIWFLVIWVEAFYVPYQGLKETGMKAMPIGLAWSIRLIRIFLVPVVFVPGERTYSLMVRWKNLVKVCL